MKKVSTAIAMQSKNISQQILTIGLDLGDRNSWYCVLYEAGQIQLEQRVRRVRKRCPKSSAPCRAARSRWKSGRIPLDQSLVERVGR